MNALHTCALLATTALGASLCAWPVLAEGPENGQVIAGVAAISRPDGKTTNINQFTDRAVIDWRRFNVSADHNVNFLQPGTEAVILNRIAGGAPSHIMGTLNANGTVMLVNPDGILFGPNSRIDVGGLVATTHDITNDDFMAGRYRFNQAGNRSASIVNEGLITARDGGVAALVAPGVRNSGIISARLGQVGLASANEFTLDLFGDNLIKLKIDDAIIEQVIDVATGQPMNALVDNQGTLSAHGGQVALTAATARRVVDHVINNDGIIEADTVGSRNGKIVLGAQTAATKTPQDPVQKVRVSGEIRARGKLSGQTGGDVHIVGEMIGLSRATIEVSGVAGGGLALIGGDIQGGTASAATLARYGLTLQEQGIPNATNVSVDRTSVIDASAIENGHGGQIIAWADDSMDFQGTVNAKGGRVGGNGGFAEVSGWQRLMFENIEADLTAPNGANGTILFDPEVLFINRGRADAIERLLNLGTNADVSAEQIKVTANIFKTAGGDATLALFADDGIEIARSVTIGSSAGRLNLFFDADTDGDGGATFLEQAMTNYAMDLAAEVDSILQYPVAFVLRTGRTDLLAYLNEIWPETETLTYGELAQRLFDKGYLTNEQLLAAQENSYTDHGASFLLNGGFLKAHDGNGTFNVTGSTIGVSTDPVTGEQLLGPFIIDAKINPNEPITQAYGGRLPGAQVADLRPTNTTSISPEFSTLDFSAIVAIGASYGQDAHTLWNLRNQTGHLMLTENGFAVSSGVVTEDPSTADATRDALVDLIERQRNSDANPFDGSVMVASTLPAYGDTIVIDPQKTWENIKFWDRIWRMFQILPDSMKVITALQQKSEAPAQPLSPQEAQEAVESLFNVLSIYVPVDAGVGAIPKSGKIIGTLASKKAAAEARAALDPSDPEFYQKLEYLKQW